MAPAQFAIWTLGELHSENFSRAVRLGQISKSTFFNRTIQKREKTLLVATFLFLKISSNFRVWIVNHLRQCAHLKLRTILQLPITNESGSSSKIGKKCFTFFLNPSQRRDEEEESVKVRMLRTFSIWQPPQEEMQQQRTGLPIEVLCLAIPVAIPPLPIPIPMSHPPTHPASSNLQLSRAMSHPVAEN